MDTNTQDLYTPRLIFLGVLSLTSLAGYINTVFLSLLLLPVSHVTGTVSRFSLDLFRRDVGDGVQILLAILGFFLGSFVTGLIIGGGQLKFGRRYGLILMLEGTVLAGSSFALKQFSYPALFLAAFACGLQNAMASGYQGMIVRTTHLTGSLTDFGVLLGRALRGTKVDPWQLILLSLALLSFLASGVLGAYASSLFGFASLWLASGFCFLLGLAYYLWRYRVSLGA